MERVSLEQRISRHRRKYGGVLIESLSCECLSLSGGLILPSRRTLYLHLNAGRSIRSSRSDLRRGEPWFSE